MDISNLFTGKLLINRFVIFQLITFCLLSVSVGAQEVYRVKGLRSKEIHNSDGKFDHHLEADNIMNELIAIHVLIIRDSVGCSDNFKLSSSLPELMAYYVSFEDRRLLSKKKTVRLEFHSKEMYDDEEMYIEIARRIIKEYPQLLEIDLNSFSAAWLCLDGYALLAIEYNDQYEFTYYYSEDDEGEQ